MIRLNDIFFCPPEFKITEFFVNPQYWVVVVWNYFFEVLRSIIKQVVRNKQHFFPNNL